ncbi:hypothetical protein [Dyadobacter luticola]|uniref:Uncharacterized protein n=1 Tax=Dyadobacter luticola TaxID=1979387 RepID=A0A5R9KW69_9BACT|nr:hypothetical protein [Dyadobacter luticola]TLV00503.1 hypothetical protein FEN17_13525 [Dyadobacter luticola]
MSTLVNKYLVTNQKKYRKLLNKVDALMKKGECNVTAEESDEILAIALALLEYEQKHFPITGPTTLEGIAELEMYEKRLNENF